MAAVTKNRTYGKIAGILDFFQNCRVVRSCCAGHFYPGQISDIINSF
jgi:hypothetical protein